MTAPLRFEEAQGELERIVRELETGGADLDRAIELWQRGEELVRFLREKLDGAEGQIEKLADAIGPDPSHSAP